MFNLPTFNVPDYYQPRSVVNLVLLSIATGSCPRDAFVVQNDERVGVVENGNFTYLSFPNN